ncbi:glycosyltransferase involved in cell wall biosynthesis [Oceanihabitans sediminis]|uniref:Glycosyltransferase n=1 Tax=Oceanihabitans sediminis TaxID=1812012 RepID=A0A368P2P7_9FLAO|nr:glycosyltransferase family 4 protein [Oceanihabitans sediminis]RBP27167.1 glycosyltransferase involved in cell wall biosynthesis [Oceanihabitans sediminis]RCU57102.1 glycosyltransferase [Oceanihabitans sediminis]
MHKRINILYTIPNFKTAGSQYVLLSLFRNIDRSVFKPYICIEKFPEVIPIDIQEDEWIQFSWSENKFRDILGFRTILKENKIDVLHSWDYKSNYIEVLACRLAGVAYLYTKKNNAWSKRWLLKSLLSSHIGYDNPEMQTRFFNSLYLRNKISFIPHGVNTDIFKPLEQLNRSTFNIVCIGNIGTNKNQLFTIKALQELPSTIHLYLYGNEEKAYRKKLEEYIDENGLHDRVHFMGFVANKDIPEVFRNADLFVLASLQEGLPVSILEALVCGIPVLSSDAGGGAKYILDEEFIFTLRDTNELKSKILHFYTMPLGEKQRITKLLKEGVSKKHSVAKEVAAYQKLYKNLKK